MTTSTRNSSAIDKALTILEKEEVKLEGDNNSEEVHSEKPAPASDHLAKFLRGISSSSSGEIDALVTDLQNLREKLVDDGMRVEQNVIAFTTLNQSVTQLAKLISDNIAQIKVPKPAE